MVLVATAMRVGYVGSLSMCQEAARKFATDLMRALFW